MKLTDFQALTFDVYGTLIDWESGMFAALEPLIDRCSTTPPRNDVLQAHARHESFQQTQTPGMRYSDLLAIVYRRLSEEWGITVTWNECVNYGLSVKHWPAFEDSSNALKYLKQHYKLVVLSNVDNSSFSHSNKKLDISFDAVYTAEDVGAYKPAGKNFEYMINRLRGIGVPKSQILHTAESMFHDHAPANTFGLCSCHIYRRFEQQGFGATMTPEQMPKFQFRFNSMDEMAQAVRAELDEA